MDNVQFFTYLLLMAGTTYLLRALPFALFTKKIENRYVKAFLAYIPYAVLAAMTIPSAIYATKGTVSAIIGLAVAAILALRGMSLTVVALFAVLAAFVVELLPL